MDNYREAYNTGHEILPDYAYDAMADQDAELDDIGQGDLIEHMHPMLSLPTHFLDIDNLTNETLAKCGMDFSPLNKYDVSYKYDGVPCSAILGANGWQRCVSRGKRFQGFLMPAIMLTRLPEPLKLPYAGQQIDFRGEFVISNSDFEAINATLLESERYANPRSMVSAQINSKQPNELIVSKMQWFAHAIWLGNQAFPHFAWLKLWLPETSICLHTNCTGQALAQVCKDMYSKAMHYEYPCDGIVIQHRISADNDGRCNLDRIAIKQHDEAKYSGETEVIGIEWRLANNGSYFPWLIYKPVIINGSDVKHTAGYCYDYLIRMNLSIGAKVVITMRGGVIPYVSRVSEVGTGNLNLPKNSIAPEKGDMHLWSSDSEDAIARVRFIRGMHSLDLADCGDSLFNAMFDAGFTNIFEVAKAVKMNTLHLQLVELAVLPDTPATKVKAETIVNRFRTINYVWCILALRIPGIGIHAANIAGHILSGYTIQVQRGGNKTAIQNLLANAELVNAIKLYSNPVLPEHANLRADKPIEPADNRKKVCMSKKPTNGMTKAEFMAKYLSDFQETGNIKDADLLVCPDGENSNKIAYAKANGIEIRSYTSFIA